MIGAVDNVRSTTAHAQCHKIQHVPLRAGTGMFDATIDGGRPRKCHSKDWFWTGFVVALAVVALAALAVT